MTNARMRILLLGLALVTAACTASQDTGSSSSVLSDSTTNAGVSEASWLLITDTADRVVIVAGDGTVLESIEPPGGARYSQPIWASPDTIVYAQEATGNNRLEAVRIGGGIVWAVDLETPPFYYLPAPDTDSTTVLSLRNRPDGSGLVIERISNQGSPEVVADEAPFYASWNPNDGRLASHVGDARLDIISRSTETIDSNASGFQAPIWLPSGLITLRTRGSDTYLTLWNDASFEDIARVRGAARFVGSQDNLAIITGGAVESGGVQASAQALPTITSGVLTVVDLAQGTFTSVTPDPSPIFQWDPVGERLLYVTFVDDPAPALTWHVWDDGEVTDFEPFTPEPSWFATVAPFFDQYAQSISLWSPDGSAFAYPALVDGAPQIMVQNLTDESPVAITPGTWVTWNPGI